MKKINNEKDTVIILYEENLNDIIWTHKIHETFLDKLNKNYKIYIIIKESIKSIIYAITILVISCLSTISKISDILSHQTNNIINSFI